MRRMPRHFLRLFTSVALASVPASLLAFARSDYLLELGGVEGESSDDKHKNQIEILSWSWGATQSADALTDGLLILRNSDKPSEKAGKVSKVDSIAIKQKTVDQTAASGGVRVAAGDVNGDGAAASGLPTGKRQHKPMILKAPLARGSVTMTGRFPACKVGTRYPRIVLGGAGKRFTMEDAIITRCSATAVSSQSLPMEEVSFNYARLR